MSRYRVYSDQSRFAVPFTDYNEAEKYAEMKSYMTGQTFTIMEQIDDWTPWHQLTTINNAA